MSYEGRRTRRRIISAAALGVAALALSGCMRMQVDAAVTENDTINGTVVMAMSDEVLALAGDSADDIWGDNDFEDAEGATVEDYAQDGFTGKKYTFKDTPLADFGSEGMSITRDGDEFVVDGNLDMTDLGEDMQGMEGFMESLDVSVSFTFPGKIIEANDTATVTGNTVSWKAAPGEANLLQARASATSGSSLPIGLIIGIVAAVVVVGAVIAILLVNRRKDQGAPVEAAPVDGVPAEPVYAPAAEAVAPAEPVAVPEPPAEPAAEEPKE